MKRLLTTLLFVSCTLAAEPSVAGPASVAALAPGPGNPRLAARGTSPQGPPVAAQDFSPASVRFTGRVVGVPDGDSLRVLRDGREVEVRLHGVDAPEGGQAFGRVARRFLANLVFGKTVEVEVRDIDRYARRVARVTVDRVDIGFDMIRAGYAWHYSQFSDNAQYAAAEREARSARRGLWQDRAPIAPWRYRQSRNLKR